MKNWKKKLKKKFLVKKKYPCAVCGKEVDIRGTVSIIERNPEHFYHNSKRPFESHYSFKLCPTHYKMMHKEVGLMFKRVYEKFYKNKKRN